MPVYQYKGLTSGNKTARGMVTAESVRAARLKLRADGIYPTHLAEGRTRSAASESLSRFKLPELRRVSPLDLALFTGQLSTLLGAGMPRLSPDGWERDYIGYCTQSRSWSTGGPGLATLRCS